VTALEQLAAYLGIEPEYVDQTGRERRVTSDETRRALLASLGIDASTEDAARAALASIIAEDELSLLPPVRVAQQGDGAAPAFEVRAPAARSNSGPWRLELDFENGDRRVAEGPWRGDAVLRLTLPEDIPLGYHRLRLALSSGGDEWSGEQTLIVVPRRCVTPTDIIGERDAFGLIANLYTIRSSTNWGIGDFSDLASLATWGASVGAAFVGVNPLHALLNRGADIAPYSPVSRLFRNPIYIDVARVPELQHATDLRERLSAPELRSRIEELREYPDVRYEQVMATKGLALDALHRVFLERVRGSGDPRERAYDEYVAQHDPALTRFAIWMAIAETRASEQRGPYGGDWRSWPAELQSPENDAVRRFAEQHAQRVDFHRWLQFEADRQLAEAACRARDAGMPIGLYQDLAIGTSAAGADAWAARDLFVHGACVGAPPDAYSATGQNWGLPPLNPRALKQNGYRYFVDILRSGFRHAGALRIDHILGLFRLFWIPDGRPGSEGAYIRYPTDDLLGIVALESVRHNAIVVGEDLGTIPHEVPEALQRWGILSSKVLLFERDHDRFKAEHEYPRLALATADTHDMPPLTGYWQGRDIDVRAGVGLMNDDDEIERARAERDRDYAALLDRLREAKVLASDQVIRSPAELRAAVHAFLCRTPSQLVGIALDDLAGEVEPVNVPGVGPDKHPSWTRKMRTTLETLFVSSDVHTALRCDGRVRSNVLPDATDRSP
jgi:4-alpha-glucanotransferase